MNADPDTVREAQVRKVIRRAFKQLFEDIANEPTLVIELTGDEDSISTKSPDDVREWLFRRR